MSPQGHACAAGEHRGTCLVTLKYTHPVPRGSWSPIPARCWHGGTGGCCARQSFPSWRAWGRGTLSPVRWGLAPVLAHSQPCPQGRRRVGAVAVGSAGVTPRGFWGPLGLSLWPQRVWASPAGVASRLVPLQPGGCQGSVLSREQAMQAQPSVPGLQPGSLEESRHQPALTGIEGWMCGELSRCCSG